MTSQFDSSTSSPSSWWVQLRIGINASAGPEHLLSITAAGAGVHEEGLRRRVSQAGGFWALQEGPYRIGQSVQVTHKNLCGPCFCATAASSTLLSASLLGSVSAWRQYACTTKADAKSLALFPSLPFRCAHSWRRSRSKLSS